MVRISGPRRAEAQEAVRELINPVWSATTCDFPGVGVYLGLAPRFEHLIIARMLSPKQIRLFTGAIVGVGKTGAAIEYYAVRDPSVVRVIPLPQPPLPNGFRHVKLAFQFERPHLLTDAVTMIRMPNPGSTRPSEAPVGFLITIGLAIGQEEDFYRRAIAEHEGQEFADLYARIADLAGCWG